MTTTPNPHRPNNDPDPRPANGSEPQSEDRTGPLYQDVTRCLCGALAGQDGLCRKCRARATWNRRRTNRDRRAAQPATRPPSRRPSPDRSSGRDSTRPRGRRTGR